MFSDPKFLLPGIQVSSIQISFLVLLFVNTEPGCTNDTSFLCPNPRSDPIHGSVKDLREGL